MAMKEFNLTEPRGEVNSFAALDTGRQGVGGVAW